MPNLFMICVWPFWIDDFIRDCVTHEKEEKQPYNVSMWKCPNLRISHVQARISVWKQCGADMRRGKWQRVKSVSPEEFHSLLGQLITSKEGVLPATLEMKTENGKMNGFFFFLEDISFELRTSYTRPLVDSLSLFCFFCICESAFNCTLSLNVTLPLKHNYVKLRLYGFSASHMDGGSHF